MFNFQQNEDTPNTLFKNIALENIGSLRWFADEG